jgi:hypothetical protein
MSDQETDTCLCEQCTHPQRSLPERWVDLIHHLNQMELREEHAKRKAQPARPH